VVGTITYEFVRTYVAHIRNGIICTNINSIMCDGGVKMARSITIVDILNILGTLEDESGTQSSRNKFLNGYLQKLSSIEEVTGDVTMLLDSLDTSDEKQVLLYGRAYADLTNRLAEIAGFKVNYVKYSNRERITGIWEAGNDFKLKVAAFIPFEASQGRGISRHALLVLPEPVDFQRPFVTFMKLAEFLNMVVQINLPLSTIAGVLSIDDNYDKKLAPVMELSILAFKSKLAPFKRTATLQSEWDKEEIQTLLNKLKPATRVFLTILLDKESNASEIYAKMNPILTEMGEPEVKSPMAVGAIMGALSKHYAGIKEPLVFRKNRRYFINEKYRELLSELLSSL